MPQETWKEACVPRGHWLLASPLPPTAELCRQETPQNTLEMRSKTVIKKKPGPTLHRRLLSNLVSSKHSTPLPPSEPLPALFLHPQPDDSRHNQVSPSLQCSPPTLDRSFQPCALPTPTSTYVFGMKSTCCAR